MRFRSILGVLAASILTVGPAVAAGLAPPPPPPPPAPGAPPGAEAPPAPDAPGATAPAPDVTPPRLGGTWGSVSFWRPGDEQWAAAQVNTPLAPGDSIATGADGTAEIQIGPRAFVRVRPGTQIELNDQQPDRLTLRLDAGEVSIDLREVPAGQAIAVQTTAAVLAPQGPGLYRARFDQTAAFEARGGGRAGVLPANGAQGVIGSGEQVTIAGAGIDRRPAPPEDAWDRWNEARTAVLVASPSAQYVSADMYGTQDLDRYGSWSSTPDYGEVWYPASVPAGWMPYGAGRWIWDARYHWTWVDDAPWGWAPFHYGRWVEVRGRWAWVPGPRVVRPAYSPALVVFLDGPVIATRPVGWAALSWGEPLVPWWGPPRFAGVPTWRGWHGPRVVNNVVVQRTTVVNVKQITVYRNVNVNHGVVAVPHDRFGHDHVGPGRLANVDVRQLEPLHEALPVRSVRANVTPPRRPDNVGRRDAHPPADRRKDDGGDRRNGPKNQRSGIHGPQPPAAPAARVTAPRERDDRDPRTPPVERTDARTDPPSRPAAAPAEARRTTPRLPEDSRTRPAARGDAPGADQGIHTRPAALSPATAPQTTRQAPARPGRATPARPDHAAPARAERAAPARAERPAARTERAADHAARPDAKDHKANAGH